jgi:hypothetical protein
MDPWIDEHLVVLAIDQVVLATKANNFSIYNILMFKTYVTSLELQYLFDNQLVSNCFFFNVLFIDMDYTNYYICIKYV